MLNVWYTVIMINLQDDSINKHKYIYDKKLQKPYKKQQYFIIKKPYKYLSWKYNSVFYLNRKLIKSKKETELVTKCFSKYK